MKWLTNQPTKPGYYWYWGPVRKVDFKLKNHRLWDKTIARVFGHPESLCVTFLRSSFCLYLEDIPDDAKWSEPIEEPE